MMEHEYKITNYATTYISKPIEIDPDALKKAQKILIERMEAAQWVTLTYGDNVPLVTSQQLLDAIGDRQAMLRLQAQNKMYWENIRHRPISSELLDKDKPRQEDVAMRLSWRFRWDFNDVIPT